MSTVLAYLDAETYIERYFYFSLRQPGNSGGWLFQSSSTSAFSAIGYLYMGPHLETHAKLHLTPQATGMLEQEQVSRGWSENDQDFTSSTTFLTAESGAYS